VWYELWSDESRNLLHEFDSEMEALDAAREYLTPDQSGRVVGVTLVVYDDNRPVRSVHGAALAELIGLHTPRQTPRSA
jgi:hypothetical protein